MYDMPNSRALVACIKCRQICSEIMVLVTFQSNCQGYADYVSSIFEWLASKDS